MKYRELGRTGVQVSEIGFGAWQVGGPLRAYFERLGWISHGWGDTDDTASVALIQACADMGINFIDTAAFEAPELTADELAKIKDTRAGLSAPDPRHC